MSHECVARGIPEHPECFGPVTAQHWPKRSQDGNPKYPRSRVVGYLCWGLHDAIDSGFRYQGRRWKNDVVEPMFRVMDRDTDEVLAETVALAA